MRYAKDIAAASISALVSSAVDMSDMYRASIVQGVSAFDYFIHDEVRSRMLALQETAPASWPLAYGRFRVNLVSVSEASTVGHSTFPSNAWLETEIRDQHKMQSFQHPDKVAEAIRLVSNVRLWDEVARELGITHQGKLTPDQKVKNQLKLVVDRRNLIAHEADLDPTPPRLERYPIDKDTADDALRFIDELGHAISTVLSAVPRPAAGY